MYFISEQIDFAKILLFVTTDKQKKEAKASSEVYISRLQDY